MVRRIKFSGIFYNVSTIFYDRPLNCGIIDPAATYSSSGLEQLLYPICCSLWQIIEFGKVSGHLDKHGAVPG